MGNIYCHGAGRFVSFGYPGNFVIAESVGNNQIFGSSVGGVLLLNQHAI